MVVIYILAVIGGLSLLGIFVMLIAFALTPDNGEEYDDTIITCALTDERCIFTEQRATCNGCPIAEEAEKQQEAERSQQ